MSTLLSTGISDAYVREFLVGCGFDPSSFLCSYVAYQHFNNPQAPLVVHVAGALTLLGSMVPPPGGNIYAGDAATRSQLIVLLTGDGGLSGYAVAAKALRALGTVAQRPIRALNYTERHTEMAGYLETDPDSVFLLGTHPWLYAAMRNCTASQAGWRETLCTHAVGAHAGNNVPLLASAAPRPSFFGAYAAVDAPNHERDTWGSEIVALGLSLACPRAADVTVTHPQQTWEQGSVEWNFHQGGTRLGALLTAKRGALTTRRAYCGVDDDLPATTALLRLYAQKMVEGATDWGVAVTPSIGHENRMSHAMQQLAELFYALCAIFAYEDNYRNVPQGTEPRLWGIGAVYRARAAVVLGWHAASLRAVSLTKQLTPGGRLKEMILRQIPKKNGARRSHICRALRDQPPKAVQDALEDMTGVTIAASICRDDPGDLLYTRISENGTVATEGTEAAAPAPPPTAHHMGSAVSSSLTEPAPLAGDDYDD